MFIASGSNVCGITKQCVCGWYRAKGNSQEWEFLLQPLAVFVSGSGADLLAAGTHAPFSWMLHTQDTSFGATGALLPYMSGGHKMNYNPKKQKLI